MPIGCLFVGESDAQKGLLAKGLANYLHSDREVLSEPGRHGDSRDSGYVDRHGAYIT